MSRQITRGEPRRLEQDVGWNIQTRGRSHPCQNGYDAEKPSITRLACSSNARYHSKSTSSPNHRFNIQSMATPRFPKRSRRSLTRCNAHHSWKRFDGFNKKANVALRTLWMDLPRNNLLGSRQSSRMGRLLNIEDASIHREW